ncbi:MAG: ROK family protein, partial [Coleofasciculaceae cyanobacterium SM2_3_26]|nr:ROK family protein [Coleofasciculaceae cyanobacterium SM2_3_26]
IGVSFGGPADADTGTVRLSHHVPGWEQMPLSQLLQERFGAPAKIDNDANIAALGEHCFGAGRGKSSLFYITVSTGVGGGWILNGCPWRGMGGMAGEIGHAVVDPRGPLCLCGKRGCVERLASGPYIAQQARDLLVEYSRRGRILRDIIGERWETLTAQQVSQAAAAGDDVAREVLSRAAWALGVAIGNVANVMNPERFILGGGVMKSGASFWATIQRVARKIALPEVALDIVPAALGDEAPLWGAVALAQGRDTANPVKR